MKYICPDHLKGYCKKANFDKYKIIDNYSEESEYQYTYEIKCKCENDKFEIYLDEHPTVEAVCLKCKKRIIIYELSNYPSAEKLDTKFDLNKFTSNKGDKAFNVCIMIEYSDEFSYDDEEFDNNDITWVIVLLYGTNSKEIFEIVNDEIS